MDDNLIIKNISRKKNQGLEMLIDKYGGFITSIIKKNLYNLRNYEDECMDDILLSIWNNIDRFDGSKNTFKNWIASVTRYRVVDYKRKYIKTLVEESIDIHNLNDSLVVEENILNEELRDEINNLLDNLKPKDKDLFIKHYLDDKNVDELSKEIGVKTVVIYNRLSRGRSKLRGLFSGERFY